jgi:hypothetical protein
MNNELAMNPSLSITEESKEQTTFSKNRWCLCGDSHFSPDSSYVGCRKRIPENIAVDYHRHVYVRSCFLCLAVFWGPAGIRNNNIMFKSMTSKGTVAWITAIVLTGFYIIVYWFAWAFEGMIRIFDPLSQWISGQPATQWFMYGAFYSLAVIIMGIRFIGRHRHNRYHVIRTFSVMFFQLGIAFLLPMFLKKLNEPEFYFSYFWPLKYNYLFPSDVSALASEGNLRCIHGFLECHAHLYCYTYTFLQVR